MLSIHCIQWSIGRQCEACHLRPARGRRGPSIRRIRPMIYLVREATLEFNHIVQCAQRTTCPKSSLTRKKQTILLILPRTKLLAKATTTTTTTSAPITAQTHIVCEKKNPTTRTSVKGRGGYFNHQSATITLPSARLAAILSPLMFHATKNTPSVVLNDFIRLPSATFHT